MDVNGITNMTGCLRPCTYEEYIQAGRRTTTSRVDEDNYLFSLWSNSDDIFVKTEELIYPWTAFVAEFGGTLGLFLGFSFMTLWDGVQWAADWIKTFQLLCSALKYGCLLKI